MSTNKQRTKESLLTKNRVTYQRMRICIEVDVPEEDFYRDNFNQAVVELATTFEQQNRGCNVVLVTTEDA